MMKNRLRIRLGVSVAGFGRFSGMPPVKAGWIGGGFEMRINRNAWKRRPWASICGFAAVVLYAAFTGIAVKLFPGKFSLDRVFISILGMGRDNPDGAAFFNMAMVMCGIFGILFFLAMFAAGLPANRGRLTTIGLTAGLVNSLSVTMTGAFAEDVNLNVHLFWSYLIFASIVPMLIAYSALWWRRGGFSRCLAEYGVFACVVDILFVSKVIVDGLIPGLCSVLEWCAVFTYLAWVALVSIAALRNSNAPEYIGPFTQSLQPQALREESRDA